MSSMTIRRQPYCSTFHLQQVVNPAWAVLTLAPSLPAGPGEPRCPTGPLGPGAPRSPGKPLSP